MNLQFSCSSEAHAAPVAPQIWPRHDTLFRALILNKLWVHDDVNAAVMKKGQL